MICYICKLYVTDFQSLVVHFKIMHMLKSNSTYQCCEDMCSQSFQSLATFKRHILKKHCLSNHTVQHQNPSETLSQSILEPNIVNPINRSDSFNDVEFLTETPLHNAEIPFNYDEVVKNLYMSTTCFILSLYNNNNFNNSDIDYIKNGIKNDILKPLSSIFEKLVGNLVETNTVEPSLKLKIKNFKLVILDPFQYCSTEYGLSKWLLENNFKSNIKQFTINNDVCTVSHGGEVIYDEKLTKGALLDLKFQFKKYFELDNNFELHYNTLNQLKSNTETISNFVQADLWKKKTSLYEGKIVFPFFLYIDDVEINNPLGSHANFQTITAIYYSFPLAKNNSQLINIFVAALVKSIDLKKFGNDSCLNSLINEINILEKEGICISTKNGSFQVYFLLGLVLGDNLGLNSILEFSRSFSSNYYCRFCKVEKSIMRTLCEEDNTMMRNIENYTEDIAKNNFSCTGLYKESILNKIFSFHVTSNFCVDVMHDVFEGVCHYDMCHIIKYYVYTVQLFSLNTLNNRKSNFNYGSLEVGNISPPIKDIHLNKCHLKMSAREMMTFIHFFPLMIGDLIIEGDEVWQFFLILIKLIDILLSNTFNQSAILHLKNLIMQHNSLYISLFNDTLKPKHHFLVHYPTIIQYSGPPRHFWCFRFEAKHREMKIYARTTSSRKNITLTLAKKSQLKFSNFLIKQRVSNLSVKDKHIIHSSNINYICEILSIKVTQFTCYDEIEYNGTKYKKGYYLTQFLNEMCLFEISELIVK